MQMIVLKTPAIFSFSECLKFLRRAENECLFAIEKENIRKLFVFDEQPVIVEIACGNDENLELTFLNKIPSDLQIEAIKNYVTNWLDLKHDLSDFYKIAEKDKLLNPLIEKYRGLKLIGIPDFYEAICWAIIGQQINLGFAYAVKRNLVEKFGAKCTFEGNDYFAFPSPEKVLSIRKEDFSEMKFSRQKVDYIQTVSKMIVDKTLDVHQLSKLDYHTAKSKLLQIRGVGNWTADYVLMKTFRHPQAFPIRDAGFLNALKTQLELSKKPDLATILQLSKNWKGHEAYATFYLWRSLID